MNAPKPATIDEYIESFPPRVQPILRSLRGTIAKAAPGAEEAIKYNLPTFVLEGNLVFFGGFNFHCSLFAFGSHRAKFKARLAKYKTGKGSVQFPYGQKLPVGLIRDIVRSRVRENLAKAETKRAKKRRLAGGLRQASSRSRAT